jgi:hypothetical protein
MEGAGFGEGIVRRESREKRIRRGEGEGASDMVLKREYEHGRTVNKNKRKTHGKRKSSRDRDFVEEDAWRFILAERMDWDSAKSSERKERNCCSSQRGCRFEYRAEASFAGGEREEGKEPRRGT